MQQRKLGRQGLEVSALGLGCMGMSEFYGQADEQESLATIERALDLGITFFDTADMYGVGRNEELVGRALRPHRSRVIIATKFGNVRGPNGEHLGVDGRPEYVRQACEASLKRLGVDHIDLYYQHRVDPKTPIEETVGAMAELVKAGKVRYLGYRRRQRRPCGGRIRFIPSPPCRPNIPCGRAIPSRTSCRPVVSWASASCLIAPWDAAFSPGASSGPRICPRTTGAAIIRVSRARTSSVTCGWCRPCARSQAKWLHTQPIGAGLGAGAGGGDRADPRYSSCALSGGECGCACAAPERCAAGADRCRLPARCRGRSALS